MLDVICRCQPQPPFALRGTLAKDDAGDFQINLTLPNGAVVFGAPGVGLKRVTPYSRC